MGDSGHDGSANDTPDKSVRRGLRYMVRQDGVKEELRRYLSDTGKFRRFRLSYYGRGRQCCAGAKKRLP
jgi:hypothetical protein